MTEHIYSKVFVAHRNIYYDNEHEARKKALKDVNKFFLERDGLCVVNIIEKWNDARSYLELIVYYKDCV